MGTQDSVIYLNDIVRVQEIGSIKGILNAYSLDLSNRNSRGFVKEAFNNELDKFPGLAERVDLSGLLEYHFFKTDSTSAGAGMEIFDTLMDGKLRELKFSDDDIYWLSINTHETYLNAWLFGSRAGREDDYLRRDMTPPTPEERIINLKKPIALEFLLADDLGLVRITDRGEGIKEYHEEKGSLKPSGRGILIRTPSCDCTTHYHSPSGFAVSMLKYKNSEIKIN